ncbi:MAG: hypothetical protein HRU46_05450 [Verrucomicrobiales bacterium]|nr:hypothetical protein [Verrucomicrobiales bacterium]
MRWVVLWYCCALSSILYADEGDASGDTEPITVFDSPAKQNEYSKLKQTLPLLFNQKKWPEAENALNQLLQFTPWDPVLHYQLTRIKVLRGDTEAALRSLEEAINLGMTEVDTIDKDPILSVLRLTTRYPELLKQAAENRSQAPAIGPKSVNPSPISEGIATLNTSNTFYDFRVGVFRSLFSEPSSDDFQTRSGKKKPDKTTLWLQEQVQAGNASGHLGNFYDNRDAGHSNLDTAAFPLLARIAYGPIAKKHGLHNGPQFRFLYDRVTIGNSSTAITGGAFWRSHPRFAYSDPQLTALLGAQYSSNQLYLYPEHLDHDPEYGDLFPANTPYLLISQGSSGSDQPFLKALFEALAALKPEVKDKLIQSGAIMPTLQQLFRYSNKGIQSDAAYLSGAAHPSVFDSANLDRDYLVRSANALELDHLPPIVRLKVIAEERALSGSDYSSPRPEVLFNTPQAIARVFRGKNFSRKMVISAENSTDLNGAPLTFKWVLLRGDPERVTIQPSADGTSAELQICHHVARPISSLDSLESSRVDIGVFAGNGHYWSAPAFITYHFLKHEERIYDEQGRILSIDYRTDEASPPYIDPMIDGRRDWIDNFHYSESSPSQLLGWTRTFPDRAVLEFAPQGVLIASGSHSGTIQSVKGVRYLEKQTSPETPPTIVMETTDNEIPYEEFLKRLENAQTIQKNSAKNDTTIP